jgi:hypothetical protein
LRACPGLGRASWPPTCVAIESAHWSRSSSSRSELRKTTDSDFEGGAVDRSQALDETEHDYVALVAADAEAAQLEAQLEAADREASDREVDLAALVVAQLQELVNAVAGRLPMTR